MYNLIVIEENAGEQTNMKGIMWEKGILKIILIIMKNHTRMRNMVLITIDLIIKGNDSAVMTFMIENLKMEMDIRDQK